MKVYRHLSEFIETRNPVITIGIFDGVHRGHQKILKRLRESAEKLDGESLLLSFFPHPRMVLNKGADDLRLLNTLDEKLYLLGKFGLENIIVHPFTQEFSQTSSADFVKKILVDQLKVRKLIIGYDHHFGKDRQGSFEVLKEESNQYGFELEEISAEDIDNINISSSKIRTALLEGNVEKANEFLGYSYFMGGTVVAGDQIGRQLNFPTANLLIEEKYKLIPGRGVYAVRVRVGEDWHKGMLNIGHRPTLPGRDFSIEVHILNFEGDLYGSTISIELINRIRDEKKFENLDALKEQLEMDRASADKLLK